MTTLIKNAVDLGCTPNEAALAVRAARIVNDGDAVEHAAIVEVARLGLRPATEIADGDERADLRELRLLFFRTGRSRTSTSIQLLPT